MATIVAMAHAGPSEEPGKALRGLRPLAGAHRAARPPDGRRDPRGDWVELHQRALWRFARLLGARGTDADDLVQDALLAGLHKGIDRRDHGDAAAWLRGAVRNLWRMQQRTQRRRPAHVTLDASAEVAAAALARHGGRDGSGDEWVAALRRCLEGLDGRARQAIELRYADRLSRAAMGDALAMGEEGVKTLLRRTREILFACVQRRVRRETT